MSELNQKCITTIESIENVLAEVNDGLDHLKTVIENDEPDRIDEALEMFPSNSKMTKAFEKLGKLLSDKPWEKRR